MEEGDEEGIGEGRLANAKHEAQVKRVA